MKTSYKQFLAAALELLEEATGERETPQLQTSGTVVRTGAGENGERSRAGIAATSACRR